MLIFKYNFNVYIKNKTNFKSKFVVFRTIFKQNYFYSKFLKKSL